MSTEELLNLFPSPANWQVILQELDSTTSPQQLLATLSPVLKQWPREYLVAPCHWVLAALQQEEPRLSICTSLEGDIFDEITYTKALAEQLLSLAIVQNMSPLEQLQTAFSALSSISEYNQLALTVQLLEPPSSMEQTLTHLLEQQCTGEGAVTYTVLPLEGVTSVEKALASFFNSWFTWMDTFPKEDYHYFLQHYLLPLLQQHCPYSEVTALHKASKAYKSYEQLEILAINNKHTSLLLQFHCDIY